MVVWVTVAARTSLHPAAPSIPGNARRIPAVIDTGFNDALLLNERHLIDWLGLSTKDFPVRNELLHLFHRSLIKNPTKAGQHDLTTTEVTIPIHEGFVWLHRPIPQSRDQFSNLAAEWLHVHPGIAVCPYETGYPRLPLLGLRLFTDNCLRLSVQRNVGSSKPEFSVYSLNVDC